MEGASQCIMDEFKKEETTPLTFTATWTMPEEMPQCDWCERMDNPEYKCWLCKGSKQTGWKQTNVHVRLTEEEDHQLTCMIDDIYTEWHKNKKRHRDNMRRLNSHYMAKLAETKKTFLQKSAWYVREELTLLSLTPPEEKE